MESELPLLASKVGATAGTASSPTPTGSVTAAATTFYVNYGEGEYFLAGHVLAMEDELAIITTAGTAADVVTVTRGLGYTSGAAHAAGTEARIVDRVHNEGGAATTDSYGVPTFPYNYTQIWQWQFEFTSTEMAIDRYGSVSQFDYLEAEAVKSQLKLMERAFMEGTRIERTTRAAIAATSGMSGGLADTDAAYILAAHRNNLASAAITRKDILDLLQEIFGRTGVEYMPTHMVLNAWVKRKVNDMFETYVRTDRAETVGGAQIETLRTDYGDIDLILTNQVRPSIAYFVHMPFLAIGPLQGEEFRTVELGKTTEGMTEYQIWGEYTFMIKNPKCHGQIYGISTTT